MAFPFIWTKFNSFFPKNVLCKVWLKLAQWFWRRSFLNFVFSLCRNYLPLKKGFGPSFEETWIVTTKWCFVQSLVEIGPVVLVKKMNMLKVYRQTNEQTNRRTDGRRMTRNQKISLEFLAQVSLKASSNLHDILNFLLFFWDSKVLKMDDSCHAFENIILRKRNNYKQSNPI